MKKNKKLVFAVILFATILTTGVIFAPKYEWPDPIGSNVTTIQNV